MMISDDNVTINQDYQISSQTQLSAVDSDFKRDGYKLSYWTSNADGTGTRYDLDSIVNAAQVSDDLDFYAQWEKIVEQLLMTSINGNTYNFGYDKLPVSNVLNYKGDNQKVMSPFSENSELSNPSNLLAVNDVGGGINTVECDSFSYNCQNLTAVYLQNVTVIEATSFSNCSNLQIVYCPNLSSLNSSAFSGCSNLSLLILSSYDGVCQNDYAFWGNYDYLTIYVKDEQYKNYITATNWDNISSHISSVTQPTVTFLSGDTYETMVKIEKLNYNTSAIPPEITREGYELTGWDGDYKDVTCDTSCYAKWKENSYTVQFICCDYKTGYGCLKTGSSSYEVSGNAEIDQYSGDYPDEDIRFAVFRQNESVFSAIVNRISTGELLGDYDLNKVDEYTYSNSGGVLFYIYHEPSVMKTESVDYGNDATPPTEIPIKEGYTFTGWEDNYRNVTQDVDCYAQWEAL